MQQDYDVHLEHIQCMRRNRRERERDAEEKRRTKEHIKELKEMKERRLIREETERRRAAAQQRQQQVQQLQPEPPQIQVQQPVHQDNTPQEPVGINQQQHQQVQQLQPEPLQIQVQQPVHQDTRPQQHVEINQQQPPEILTLQEQQKQPLNDPSVESLIEPLETLRIRPIGQSSPKSDSDELQDWEIPMVKRQKHGSFDMLDEITNSNDTDELGDVSQDAQHSHPDLADSNPRKKKLTSASELKSLKYRLMKNLQSTKASELEKQQPRDSAAMTNLQLTEFSKTAVSDNSSASSSGSATSGDAAGLRGFDDPSLSDLSNYEAAVYISATSNPGSQSPESSQGGNNFLNITTPPSAPAPSHPPPKQKRNRWKDLDANTVLLAQKIAAIGPKEPSVKIVKKVNKGCDVCDNSRFWDLEQEKRQSLRCSCPLKVTNGATPPVSPAPPAPSPGPVTRNRGQPEGKYRHDGALVRYKK